MKKFFLIILILLIVFSPLFSEANNNENGGDLRSYDIEIIGTGRSITVEYEGMVPCGRCLTATEQYSEFLDSIHRCEEGTYIPCTLCHAFIIFDNVINFVLFVLIPTLAILVIVLSGIVMMVGSQKPETLSKAKKIFVAAVGGVILAYIAFAITLVVIYRFMNIEEWELNWTGVEVQHMCSLQISEDPHAEEDNNGTNSEPEDEDENDEDDPDPDKHTLRIEVQGEVGDSLTIPEPGESHEYEAEKDINIHAYPEPGYAFDGWGGDIATTDESVEITMDQDYEITATFRSVEPETILNKATGKSCNEVCLEEGMNCVSIGTNDSADSGDFWYRGTFPNITCYDDGEGSCSTDMDSYTISPNCGGYEADWTRCRCE